jgi:flagellar basal body rod protein FlgG
MSRDLYPTMTAASATWRHLEHISNNLANVNTTGFKERRVSFESVLASAQNPGLLSEGYVKISDGAIDVQSGSLIQDNVSTHFAIEGNGFFVLENAEGEQVLTRSGIFQIDNYGYLVNAMGEKVVTTTGPIQLDDFQRDNFTVTPDGRLLDDRGGEFAQLLVMDGDNLEPLLGTRWKGENLRQVEPYTYTVRQGMLENSNVNPFRNMIEMVETTRHFEMYQKAMHSSREMDSSLNAMVSKI